MIGFHAGLPFIDVRHVAFSSANVLLSRWLLAGFHGELAAGSVFGLLGIALMG